MSQLTMAFTEMDREQFQAHLDQRSVNTHDASAVASWFSEEAVQRVVSISQTARGRDEIREAMEVLFRAFPDFHIEVRDLFASGNRLCVQCTFTGTHVGEYLGVPATSRRIEIEGCLVFRMRTDGLVDEEIVYSDAATMLRQLGLLADA